MTTIRELLEGYRPEIEMRMQSQLEAMVRGSIVRTQLPQVIGFRTEREQASFKVDEAGNAKIYTELLPDPDVLIEWKHDYLVSVLRTRTLEGIPEGEAPRIILNTMRGRIGYSMLRRYLNFP